MWRAAAASHRALAALVKDSLELSIDEDRALAARWTESRTTIRLPAGMEAVTLRLPRVAYDLTGRAGGAGTLAFEGAELRFASDVPTLLDLPFRATGAFAVIGGEALDAMSTRVVALNATAVDADAFFGALLGPQHAVAPAHRLRDDGARHPLQTRLAREICHPFRTRRAQLGDRLRAGLEIGALESRVEVLRVADAFHFFKGRCSERFFLAHAALAEAGRGF